MTGRHPAVPARLISLDRGCPAQASRGQSPALAVVALSSSGPRLVVGSAHLTNNNYPPISINRLARGGPADQEAGRGRELHLDRTAAGAGDQRLVR